MAKTQEEIREANKKIADLVKDAYFALEEAAKIAAEVGVNVHFAPAYGMGGTYYPPKDKGEESGYFDSYEYYGLDPEVGGWVSSSQQC